MKKFFILSFFIAFVTHLMAQSDESVFYYYKGKKVYCTLSYDRVVVGIKAGYSIGELRKILTAKAGIKPDSVLKISLDKQLLVRLGGGERKNHLQKASIIRSLQNVLFVHPVLKEGDKYASYGSEFIVKLKATYHFSDLDSLLKVTGCKLVKKYPFRDRIYILSAGREYDYDAIKAANYFFESSLFEYSEPERLLYDVFSSVTNDPLYDSLWAHNNTAQYGGIPGADMKIQQAWNITMGDPNIKVAVIDVGVELNHPDLQANLIQGFNGITMTANPGDGAPLGITETHNHGTSCAGIIGAVANNGIGVAGVAPKCKIVPATIVDSSGAFNLTAAAASFDYCASTGVDVISNSWGGLLFISQSSLVDDAIHNAATNGRNGRGCVILFASGNSDFPFISWPASDSMVIAVGGVNMFGQRKSASSDDRENTWGANYGTGIDLLAPCVKIATTDRQGKNGYDTNSDYIMRFAGTSAATPNAAGVAALLLSVDSLMTRLQVMEALEKACDKLPGYAYTTSAGQPNGSWNNETGHGRVNALAALESIKCRIRVKANVNELCSTPALLSVIDTDSASKYYWHINGILVDSGTTLNTSVPGMYTVQRVSSSCSKYSLPVELKNKIALTALAGSSPVCNSGNVTLSAVAAVASAPLTYCSPTYLLGTFFSDGIKYVNIESTTLNNSSDLSFPPYYTSFPGEGSTTALLKANTSYKMKVSGGETAPLCLIRGWIDYNHDGVFSASESIGISGNAGKGDTSIITFSVPATALSGTTTLRLRSSDTNPGPSASQACGATNTWLGESEDYIITIQSCHSGYTYTWVESPAGNTLQSNAGCTVNASGITQPKTYTVTVTDSSLGCTASSDVIITPTFWWTGNESSRWDVAGNWNCNLVPAKGADIMIPASALNEPKLMADTVVVGNITLEKIIRLNDRALIINGAIGGTGTLSGSSTSSLIITGNAGFVRFTKDSATLKTLIIKPNANVKVNDNLIITGR